MTAPGAPCAGRSGGGRPAMATEHRACRRVVVAMMTARAWVALAATLRGMGGGG